MEFTPDMPKIDWRQIFNDMKAKGFSKTRAALTLGKEWSTVQRWVNGSDPAHLEGERILRLHELVCGADLTAQRRRGE